jgi:hypothetical protein
MGLAARMSAAIEGEVAAGLTNENVIERWWLRARRIEAQGPDYWLLLARLAEAALLCAGNYADNCEYAYAGDLLLNPREILIHSRSGGTMAKNRHGSLSRQLGFSGSSRIRALKAFAAGVFLEVTRPPLLPLMTQALKESGRVATHYLQRLEGAQRRIADTLAFLAAWQVWESAELWRRMQASTAAEKGFIESRLCRFDRKTFDRIGADLRRSAADPGFRSTFLTVSGARENGLRRLPPAGVPAGATCRGELPGPQ